MNAQVLRFPARPAAAAPARPEIDAYYVGAAVMVMLWLSLAVLLACSAPRRG